MSIILHISKSCYGGTFFFKRKFTSHSFLNGSSSNYIEFQFKAWKKDPNSVHPSWNAYFTSNDFQMPQNMTQINKNINLSQNYNQQNNLEEAIRLLQMVKTFQIRGHFGAKLDPLQIYRVEPKFNDPKQFELETYHFSKNDLNRTFDLGKNSLLTGFLATDSEHRQMTLGEIHSRLVETYCNTIGYQYMHLHNRKETAWIQNRIETPKFQIFTKEKRLEILDRLTWAHHFENFLKLKWSAQKRFGLDGAESMIPGLKTIIDTCSNGGVKDIVIGMPHRGRLNVLSTVMRKPLEQIFSEFRGVPVIDDELLGSGDVKYHLGCSTDRVTKTGKSIHMSMVANPSHLEACNPVVLGKTRAKQDYSNDKNHNNALSLLIHGDASFSGQGIVYETLLMTDLPDYTTGGTIHFICNNQIGFTTDPQYARSSSYCTDVAKSIGAPIFHVNADDVEAVVKVCSFAAEFRQTFQKDVIIDFICYRKHGHNEGDEPRFTQPYMYSKIDQHPNVLDIYRKKLLSEGCVTETEIKNISDRILSILNEKFNQSKEYKPTESDWLDDNWEGFFGANKMSSIRETGITRDKLIDCGKYLTQIPKNFTIHKRLIKVLNARQKSIETGQNIDWGTAEGLAFATLLREGCHVRLSGQDVQRGTFSHRHAVLFDQKSKFPSRTYTPLAHLEGRKGQFVVSNSPLSEYGVLGYEYGYSLESPKSLVLWEAQFGDFANGAQIVFDQFISSGEDKWRRQSGIVVLLPHGYEAGGPEHSSARIERYLQMCDDDQDQIPPMNDDQRLQIQNCNWQVVNCSTPANYFHVLRRQIHRDFRKPLILITPKSLLKLRACVSSYKEMEPGTRFRRIITERESDKLVSDDKIEKLIFCSGKIYYELAQERQNRKINNMAIVTLEQLSPFPYDRIEYQVAVRYPNAEVVWVQEEPKNMGAWSYLEPRFETALKKTRKIRMKYVGRPASASPATGFGSATHKAEVNEIMRKVFE